MKKKNSALICTLVFMGFMLILSSGCKKEDEPTPNSTEQLSLPVLTTYEVNISDETIFCTGQISSDCGYPITERGVCWSTHSSPTIADNKSSDGTTGIGDFTSRLYRLALNSTYHVRAYATNSAGTGYGNELVFTSSSIPSISSLYQGGVVAYILQPGDIGYIAGEVHGLIAAPSDQSASIKWHNGNDMSTGATASAIGSGYANTNAIIARQGDGSYAAKLCSDLVLGGYEDWYLPSIDELRKIEENKEIVGGFTDLVYWSSTEESNSTAWKLNFEYSSWGNACKSFTFSVRAIRAF